MTHIKNELSDIIWQLKYRHQHQGEVLDSNIESSWQRVAQAVASVEGVKGRQRWQHDFYRILEDFSFLPGGRILAGAGTGKKVTLFSCFVMDIAQDNLQAVFDALAEAEMTLQYGGGVGYDFSVLRPKGDSTSQASMPARGPVALMSLWNTMSAALQLSSARRGAMMAVLRCDHPDIEEFVAAKASANALRHFNLSVMVSDQFMQAVKEDADWELVFPPGGKVYRKVKAKALWKKIIRAAYDYAEPGVLFADTINRKNNLFYCETIKATNPCGEIPLQAYGACNLGSINLTRFVSLPFSAKADIQWQALDEAVAIATRFLDNIIDLSDFPLARQRVQAQGARKIGLGLCGLADALLMLGLQYSSEAGRVLATNIMRRIANVTWQTSIELAKEKGSFPFYDEEYLQGEYVKTLSSDMQARLKRHGIRNSHHNAIAPTGSISLLANNVSNGIEPIFRESYQRKIRMRDGELKAFQVEDYAYQLWKSMNKKGMPPAWQDVRDLAPRDHLSMQAVLQPYIDNAISKTINLPREFPFEQLEDVYSKAYEFGLKGCTVYRPNPVTGEVLMEQDVPYKKCCKEKE